MISNVSASFFTLRRTILRLILSGSTKPSRLPRSFISEEGSPAERKWKPVKPAIKQVPHPSISTHAKPDMRNNSRVSMSCVSV